jgi:hypothetical protein
MEDIVNEPLELGPSYKAFFDFRHFQRLGNICSGSFRHSAEADGLLFLELLSSDVHAYADLEDGRLERVHERRLCIGSRSYVL